MSCLVIKNDGIGDLVLASGIIASLAERFGEVHLVTCAQNREIAEMIPGVTRVFYVSRDDLRLRRSPLRWHLIWPAIPAADRKVLRELAAERYEVAISLRRYIRSSSLLIMRAVRARRRLACWLFPTNLPAWAARRLSRGWELYQGDATGSEASYYQTALREAFGVALQASPRLRPEKPAILAEPRTIGLSIGGAVKRWPEERWSDIAARLVASGFRVLLFGGPDCAQLATAILGQVPGVVSHVGALAFADSIPVLARLELLVSNDTGMAHFASLYCRRILVIQGGGGFGRFFPWPDQSNQYLIYHGVACFDCDWACPFPEKTCFTRIPAAEVATFAAQIVTSPGVPRIRNLNSSTVTYRINWTQELSPKTNASIAAN